MHALLMGTERDFLDLYERHLGPGKYSAGRYRFPCFRCDVGTRDKRHLYVSVRTGFYKCYKCCTAGDGLGMGTAAKFARIMGEASTFDPPARSDDNGRYEFDQAKATQVYTYLWRHMTLSDEDAEAIREKRGLEREFLEAVGVRSLRGAAELLRRHFTRDYLIASGLFYSRRETLVSHASIADGRVLIPYHDWETGDVTFVRSRHGSDADERPYLSPMKCSSGDRVWGKLIPGVREVVVTEGEFKGMASVQAKVMTLATPGMTSSHEAVARMLCGASLERIIICYDTQIANMDKVDQAARALARRVRANTHAPVYRAHLPLDMWSPEVEKMDIDTYIKLYGPAAYRAQLAKARRV